MNSFMKRMLPAVLALLCGFAAQADERSQAVLDRLKAKIDSFSSYEMDWKATLDGEFQNITGKFVVSGPRFYADVYGSELYYDGNTLYTYSRENNEVVMEELDPGDGNILSNPTRIFRFDDSFDHVFKGNTTENGKRLLLVELTPRTPQNLFRSVLLKVDEATSLPVRISYNLPESEKKMELTVTRITPGVPVSAATFTFDRSKYPGVELIDFR